MIPWEPFDELLRDPFADTLSLRDAMTRLLEESVISPRRLAPVTRAFPVDVRETDTDYVIEASLPGVKPDEMHITATQSTVTIQTSRKAGEKTEKTGTYVRRERYQGEVSRVIGLPSSIDPDNVTATYEHGVLTLHIPKVTATKGKQIKVQVKDSAAVH